MRNRKTKVKWQCGEKEWKEEVPRVIIEKTKTPLSWAWQHPLHQVPPIPPSIHPQAHHPIPSRQGNFLLPTAHPSSIYSSIHLSVPQQMEIITHNNTTTNSSLSLLSPTSHPNLSSSGWWLFWSELSAQSQWGKWIHLNHAKNVTGRFWCGLVILSTCEFHIVQANSRDACAKASIWCRRQSWFYITLDYSDTLRQPANSQ